MNGRPDPLVGAAAADIGHDCVNLRIGGLGCGVEQTGGSHQHAALAVAALGHLLGDPGFLQCVQLGCAQALNGLDLLSHDRRHGCYATAHCCAVHPHRASPAGRHAAAKFGAGHIEHIAQHPQQRHRTVGL